MEISKMLRPVFAHVLNIKFLILKTFSGQVNVIFQAISLVVLFAYEKGLDLSLLNIEKEKIYFNDSILLAFGFFVLGIIPLSVLLYSKKITCMASLFINTYIPCKLWTIVVFFVYTLITIPLNFYLVQNLYGDFEYFFKAGGYIITHLLPIILLIFFTIKVLREREKPVILGK